MLAGAAEAVVNTALVMGTMGLVLGEAFAAAQGIPQGLVGGAVWGIVLANGVPEALAAAVLCGAVCMGLDRAGILKNREGEARA